MPEIAPQEAQKKPSHDWYTSWQARTPTKLVQSGINRACHIIKRVNGP